MKKWTLKVGFLLIISLSMPSYGQDSESESGKEYRSPGRFEEVIKRFETGDVENPPPKGAIVCVGSSSMRGWHATIEDDLAPLTIIRRGFGGSNMNGLLHYADRIVLPYRPRAIVVYEGDNDVAQEIVPRKIADTFHAFVTMVHKELPMCRIYFLSIKPSIRRWNLWTKMEEANSLIATECASDERLAYVDVAAGMLDDEGKPRKDIFKKDNLHMTSAGYVIWKNILAPVLVEAELQFEPKKDSGG